MAWYERVLCVLGGLLLIYPGLATDAIGVVLVAVTTLIQLATKKKAVVEAQ